MLSPATSGGAQGFGNPWMSPKDRGAVEDVPLEVKLQAPRQVMSGASWGRQMGVNPPPQGGGAIIGGGIGGPAIDGFVGSSQHRGFYGGWGTRTGGAY